MTEPIVTEKPCKKCGATKPLADFYKSSSSKDGYRGYCKPCYLPASAMPPVGGDAGDASGLTQKCTFCDEEKPVTEFYLSRTYGRLETRCKRCDYLRKQPEYLPRRKKARGFCPLTHGQCANCKGIKQREDFLRSSYTKSGITSWCRSCLTARQKLHYKTDPEFRAKLKIQQSLYAKTEKAKAQRKAYAALYVPREEVKQRQRERHRRWNASKREHVYGYRLKAKYGLTLAAYRGMCEEQDNVCAICRESCKLRERLAVDHDHLTGQVRGLLCVACNVALGGFKDSPDTLRNAIAYLEKHGAK